MIDLHPGSAAGDDALVEIRVVVDIGRARQVLPLRQRQLVVLGDVVAAQRIGGRPGDAGALLALIADRRHQRRQVDLRGRQAALRRCLRKSLALIRGRELGAGEVSHDLEGRSLGLRRGRQEQSGERRQSEPRWYGRYDLHSRSPRWWCEPPTPQFYCFRMSDNNGAIKFAQCTATHSGASLASSLKKVGRFGRARPTSRGLSSTAEPLASTQAMRVRFPLPAPCSPFV